MRSLLMGMAVAAISATGCSGGGENNNDTSSTPPPAATNTTTQSNSTATDTNAATGAGSNTPTSSSNGNTNGNTASDATGTSTGSGAAAGGTGSSGGQTSTAPKNISNAPAANAEIAMDAQGNAIAVWQQNDGTRNNIFFSRYTGGVWSAPTLLENRDDDATTPQIAMNSAGEAWAVWQQKGNTGSMLIWGRLFSPAIGWNDAVAISPAVGQYGPVDSSHPQVAISDSGAAITVWSEIYGGLGAGVGARTYRPSAGWDTPQLVCPHWCGLEHVAIDARGNAAVAFMQGDEGTERARAAYFSADTGWSAMMYLDTESYSHDLDMHVAMDTTGNVLATWRHLAQRRPELTFQQTLVAKQFVPGAGWSAPASLLLDDTTLPNMVSVAAASTDNAIATWQETDSGVSNIYATRFLGGAWQTPQVIGPNGLNPHVTLAAGHAVAAWNQGSDIMFAQFLDTGWQAPQSAVSNIEPISGIRLAGGSNSFSMLMWLQPSGVWTRQLP